MARRRFESSFGPVLRVCVGGLKRKGKRKHGSERESSGKLGFHGEKCSWAGRDLTMVVHVALDASLVPWASIRMAN